jgi:hypothetical protein
MKPLKYFLILPFLLLSDILCSQGYQINMVKSEFIGKQLQISYDFVNARESDLFYVWVEIENKNGETIIAKAFSGDLGANIRGGTNKKITWIPERDSIFLNEEVLIEVKAEKYVKSYNRGSMMLKSAVFPGWGQTRISGGKPWWLTGVAAYGTLAGGLLVRNKSNDTYNSYQNEEDPVKRDELFNQAQKQSNISGALIVTGAAIWFANICWMAAMPNNYLPLKHVNLTLNQSNGQLRGTTSLTMKINF